MGNVSIIPDASDVLCGQDDRSRATGSPRRALHRDRVPGVG